MMERHGILDSTPAEFYVWRGLASAKLRCATAIPGVPPPSVAPVIHRVRARSHKEAMRFVESFTVADGPDGFGVVAVLKRGEPVAMKRTPAAQR